ncbi:MAG: DUF1552 domain-containing protein [Deltaproteobacteria bacterium]|nr:DUF1552 domain-containing protein [Deltaproteobacteria bacterium]
MKNSGNKSSRIVSVGPKVIERRTFLRGAFGGVSLSLGLPLLDAMLNTNGDALAATGGPLPMRFGVFHWGGGVNHKAWIPAQTGANFALPDSLKDFEDSKAYLTTVTGLSHIEASPGHIPARGIALSNSHDLSVCQGSCVGVYRGQAMPEPSLDALVAEAWKGQAPYDLLPVGICRKGPYASNSSWARGGTAYNRHEASPQALYERLFSKPLPATGSGGSPGVLDVATKMRKSVLDVLKGDATALMAKLGTTDKRRLEQHLEGLRSIEASLAIRESMPTSVSCAAPDAPAKKDFGDGTTKEEKEAKSILMSDILAVAIACDLTRVFSYEWSANQSQSIYWEANSTGQHHEDVTHGKSQSDEHARIIRFIMKNFAYLTRKLRQIPEGAGNVLDRTLIFGTSEHADAGDHNWTDHPLLLVGKAGGKVKAGVHIRGKGEIAPKVMFSAVRAVGVNITKLGHADRAVTSGFTEIEQ